MRLILLLILSLGIKYSSSNYERSEPENNNELRYDVTFLSSPVDLKESLLKSKEPFDLARFLETVSQQIGISSNQSEVYGPVALIFPSCDNLKRIKNIDSYSEAPTFYQFDKIGDIPTVLERLEHKTIFVGLQTGEFSKSENIITRSNSNLSWEFNGRIILNPQLILENDNISKDIKKLISELNGLFERDGSENLRIIQDLLLLFGWNLVSNNYPIKNENTQFIILDILKQDIPQDFENYISLALEELFKNWIHRDNQTPLIIASCANNIEIDLISKISLLVNLRTSGVCRYLDKKIYCSQERNVNGLLDELKSIYSLSPDVILNSENEVLIGHSRTVRQDDNPYNVQIGRTSDDTNSFLILLVGILILVMGIVGAIYLLLSMDSSNNSSLFRQVNLKQKTE